MNIKHFSSCITVGILICISVFSMSGCGKRADWEKVTIINHACGGIDGNSYTNSTEALDNSIKSNCESVEIDFRYTSDGTLICAHDWEDIGFESAPTLEEFKSAKICDSYTPLTAEEALKMLAPTNIFLILDTKEEDVVSVYKEIDNILSSIKGGKSYKEMLVPQVYSEEDFMAVKEIYDYDNWIFTVYKLNLKKDSQFKEIADFCKENGITVVTIPKKKVTAERLKYFTDLNIRTATHTVNSKKDWAKFDELGVNLFYTDFGRKE
ncbi:MAG: hypothetical protein K6E47_02205 [Lachnospiraceae bacterium]|nr:hypothetical protein [Lachnospiraceae bacterium]